MTSTTPITAFAMHDTRTTGDRTPLHYTMKTPAQYSPVGQSHSNSISHSRSNSYNLNHSHSHSHPHSHSHSQSLRPNKQPKTSTPLASPRMPYSVNQNHPPPKSSPRVVSDDRSPSPNYFGLIVESANEQGGGSSGVPNDNWSPSSSVKSFQAAIPKQVPLDANPEFEAFRRQADFNRGKSFALSTSHYAQPSVTLSGVAPVRPRPPRWHTHGSDTGGPSPFGRGLSSANVRPASRMDLDQDSMQDSACVSSDSNRNSESSFHCNVPALHLPRFESPLPMDSPQHRTSLTRSEDRDPRLSVMEHRPEPPDARNSQRSATLPATLEPGQPHMITGQQLKDMLRNVKKERLLLLDLRSSQNYAQSRIEGALNLCIPTTLLKRATFNIQKLKQTFQSSDDSDKFDTWNDTDYIVVYDAHASDKRDAITAQNMIKKFTNEGYTGGTCILKGGFNSFQQHFSDFVDNQSANGAPGKPGPGHGGIAPVIGGVMLPNASNDVNPFFSNIRQNMDLADGVGQLDVSRPTALDSPSLPRWLREAAAQPDHGKKVSDKFLHIEVDEQSRMKAAQVQLCGVEKGVKNRYKDILPFEHARVKLQEKPDGSCDYINASHIKASRSNKQYIATQGPLPATFEDFWSVIWQEDVRVVVMLTAETEGGQLKCHPYWKGRDFGAIRLKLLSEKKVSLDIDKHRSDSNHPSSTSASEAGASGAQGAQTEAPYVILRKFALSHASHPFAPIREITHLHFPSWPDFGTPAQPSHLLALVELANVMQRSALPVETSQISKISALEPPAITWYDEPEVDSRARPMLVHCSAGCGRTGTFCTVDSVIDMLKRQRQAKMDSVKARDYDGDVSMGENTDASPRSAKHSNFYTPGQRSNMERKAARGGAHIDTDWVHDDSVDLIQKTVEDFREQRLSMVQSLRQYVLCYETVLEWVTRMNERGSHAPNGRLRSGSLRN
ncbi:Tyrosine-protein phosphatase 1 [Fusarium culmorum]|uniref:protein-tyrosine-phosphatase n=1 Tax=Fusarium culmorum TaxID=5516 RepID=A0A2T4H668_FUSCU|nr:Tyrosine-protein phosphatase 1 [Fusarium culmorum]